MGPIPVDEYKDAMREGICSLCVSFVADSQNPTRCFHEESGQCSLFSHLPEVVDVVSKVDSGSIVPYLERLRLDVCTNCRHQDNRGICDIRDSRGPAPTWCALDAYFNLIVGVIENVNEHHAGKAQPAEPDHGAHHFVGSGLQTATDNGHNQHP